MKPYYEADGVAVYHGDCRSLFDEIGQADVVIADPPYGVTKLPWDIPIAQWADRLPTRNLWCFGSLRSFMESPPIGWTYAQEIVWEKHNGTTLHADRFRRVHELVAQFYRGDWGSLYKHPVYTYDAIARTVRAKRRPQHWGKIDPTPYRSQDGGPRLRRSVMCVRSMHGRASHPTQKPVEVLAPLIEYSCPPDGVVLDPFMGSGSTLIAARALGRKAIGIEIEERYCEVAVRRLAQEILL